MINCRQNEFLKILKNNFTIFIFLFFSGLSALAQTPEYFQDVPVWTDLDEALKTPKAIKRLNLSKSKLREIPAGVFELVNLEELDISKNQLKSLPPEIKLLRKLKVLNVSKNKLEGLPNEIGELKNLERLDASRNDLFTLPDSLGNCESLEILSFWENNLSTLPSSLKKIPNLKEIDLRVIVFSEATRWMLTDMLPGVKIHFSNECNCGPN